jgi:hypothetical protein
VVFPDARVELALQQNRMLAPDSIQAILEMLEGANFCSTCLQLQVLLAILRSESDSKSAVKTLELYQ